MCLMLGLAPWKHMTLRVDVLSMHARGMYDKYASGVVPAHVDVRQSTMRDVKALVDDALGDDAEAHDYDEDALNVAGDGECTPSCGLSASGQSGMGVCASCGRELAAGRAAVGCGACGARAHAACMARHFFTNAGEREKHGVVSLFMKMGRARAVRSRCRGDKRWRRRERVGDVEALKTSRRSRASMNSAHQGGHTRAETCRWRKKQS